MRRLTAVCLRRLVTMLRSEACLETAFRMIPMDVLALVDAALSPTPNAVVVSRYCMVARPNA